MFQLFLVVVACLGFTTILFLLLKKSSVALSIDVGGAIFNAVVAVYSILLGFVVVLVWQQYQNAGDRMQEEASKAFNLYRSSHAFPDSSGQKVRNAITQYIQSVCKDEWPAMKHDSTSNATKLIYQNIWTAVQSVQPATEGQKVWYASMVETLGQLGEARTLRLSDTEESVPGLMWGILGLGAFITVGFASLLVSKNNKMHLIKVLLFALLLTLNGILIFLLDHPYSGVLSLNPGAYERILNSRISGPKVISH